MHFSKKNLWGSWRAGFSRTYPASSTWAAGLCQSGEKSARDGGTLAGGSACAFPAVRQQVGFWIGMIGVMRTSVGKHIHGRMKGVHLPLFFVMMAKDKGISLFDFSVVMGFLILSGRPLCKASILLLYSESPRCFLIDSHWSAHIEDICRVIWCRNTKV